LMFAILMAGPVTGAGIQSDEVEMSAIGGGSKSRGATCS
jgi:hypothetical protein